MNTTKLWALALLWVAVSPVRLQAETRLYFEDTPPRANTISFFYGMVKFTSPDGKRLFGESTSLVKRVVQPAAWRIEEIVAQPGRKPGDPPVEHITQLSRIGNVGSSATFGAVDVGKTFTGTLSFKGAEWAWESWTYDIALAAGGKITGEGTLSKDGIRTRKNMFNKEGQPTVLVAEDLRPITEQKYNELRLSLFPAK